MTNPMQTAATLPIMRWSGWRPPFLQHEADQRAGHLVLLLEREGETMLLPCAQVGYCFAFPTWQASQEADAIRRIWGDGAAAYVVEEALAQLEADGWRVVGRLLIEFVGVLAEDDFWSHVQAVLSDRKETE